ncbi:MAG: DUF2934 domain-containing protein [Cyanobacteria bacterium CYA]|nr:MAG: DUF2934 domain-containing protein [Cyanobacteria bacterium CYA]
MKGSTCPLRRVCMSTKTKTHARSRSSVVALDFHTSAHESKPRPTEDQIRDRAYQLFIERGCMPGSPVIDWLDAEQQLIHELRSTTA